MPLPKIFFFNNLRAGAALRTCEKCPTACRIYKVEFAANAGFAFLNNTQRFADLGQCVCGF